MPLPPTESKRTRLVEQMGIINKELGRPVVGFEADRDRQFGGVLKLMESSIPAATTGCFISIMHDTKQVVLAGQWGKPDVIQLGGAVVDRTCSICAHCLCTPQAYNKDDDTWRQITTTDGLESEFLQWGVFLLQDLADNSTFSKMEDPKDPSC